MKALVIAEHDNKTLNPATRSLVTAALQLADTVDVLVMGADCNPVAQSAAKTNGVAKVLLADNPACKHQLAEALTPAVLQVATGYSAILAASSTTGKNLLPRVAALLDVAQLSEVVRIEDKDTFTRPIYAGNALARVRSADPVKVITIRASSFEEAAVDGNAVIEPIAVSAVQQMSRFVSENLNNSARPQLEAAITVVSGGRGLGSAENFALVENLADRLGAAIGASRAAVDAGYVGNELQVGQTGKIVAPDLYIAVGISGAIQHLAGMKESRIIVAINKDPEAPIFQVADYGLVGDLFEILPELEKLLA